ncbi:prepilin peptidase [Trinickia sp. Y13]|uniref:prepilin peptidase n=1 Tax=Trinickia sp. Y13 TaxID=2917807 RepID=UPI0024072BB8|nr:prepilin peptidase [Trinickia sp. Y13]MDG0023283.1 prepilin peptidase [Trinickia sp. Y13]
MFLINALASALLLTLALSDLRRRRLPNASVAAFAALYLAHAWLGAENSTGFEHHLATGALALVLSALLFRFGWLGGGDAKLFAAVFLWSGPAHASTVFFIVSFLGLLLALAQLALRRVPSAAAIDPDRGWLAPARGVPYGVALAAGGIAAIWLPPAIGHAPVLGHAAWSLLIHARLT